MNMGNVGLVSGVLGFDEIDTFSLDPPSPWETSTAQLWEGK